MIRFSLPAGLRLALPGLALAACHSGADTDTDAPGAHVRAWSSADAVVTGLPGGAAGSAVAIAPLGGGGPELVVGEPLASRVCLHELAACLTGDEDLAGASLATGDLDGDGAVDLVVGGPGRDGADADVGGAWLVRGPVTGGALADAWASFVGEAALDAAGTSVAAPGDVSGDGVPDLVVGAPGNDAGGGEAGMLYVVRGPVTAGAHALADANTTLQGAGAERHGSSGVGDALATSVAAPGDLDGDGIADLLVSAGGSDQGAVDGGRVAVLLGPIPSGHLGFAAVDAVLVGERAAGFAGEPVSGGGDLDGDGLPDVVVAENGAAPERIAVFSGAPGDAVVPLAAAPIGIEAAAPGDGSGWAITLADTDGDGADDLVAGAPAGDGDAIGSGAVYVLWGPLEPGVHDLGDAPVRLHGGAAGDGAGRALAAGDVDGDGRADVLVGAPFADGGAGSAALFLSDG